VKDGSCSTSSMTCRSESSSSSSRGRAPLTHRCTSSQPQVAPTGVSVEEEHVGAHRAHRARVSRQQRGQGAAEAGRAQPAAAGAEARGAGARARSWVRGTCGAVLLVSAAQQAGRYKRGVSTCQL